MYIHEWSTLRRDPQLDIGFLHARYRTHAYPRHSHDYYVIALIERGVQSCTYAGAKGITLPGGLILLNPSMAHTGEAADEHGFEYRALYPTVDHMRRVAHEVGWRHGDLPFFGALRVYNPELTAQMRALHAALNEERDPLERESRLLWTLAQLVTHYGNPRSGTSSVGEERHAVQQARTYLDGHFAEGVTLEQLAAEVGFSPYYLLRVFRNEVGMPPHAYLESVRIREAQRMLAAGHSCATVAQQTGFSTQSHFTTRFKRVIGVPPGEYVRQHRAQR